MPPPPLPPSTSPPPLPNFIVASSASSCVSCRVLVAHDSCSYVNSCSVRIGPCAEWDAAVTTLPIIRRARYAGRRNAISSRPKPCSGQSSEQHNGHGHGHARERTDTVYYVASCFFFSLFYHALTATRLLSLQPPMPSCCGGAACAHVQCRQ